MKSKAESEADEDSDLSNAALFAVLSESIKTPFAFGLVTVAKEDSGMIPQCCESASPEVDGSSMALEGCHALYCGL